MFVANPLTVAGMQQKIAHEQTDHDNPWWEVTCKFLEVNCTDKARVKGLKVLLLYICVVCLQRKNYIVKRARGWYITQLVSFIPTSLTWIPIISFIPVSWGKDWLTSKAPSAKAGKYEQRGQIGMSFFGHRSDGTYKLYQWNSKI